MDAKLIGLLGYRFRRIQCDPRLKSSYVFMAGKGGRTHTGNCGLILFESFNIIVILCIFNIDILCTLAVK